MNVGNSNSSSQFRALKQCTVTNDGPVPVAVRSKA